MARWWQVMIYIYIILYYILYITYYIFIFYIIYYNSYFTYYILYILYHTLYISLCVCVSELLVGMFRYTDILLISRCHLMVLNVCQIVPICNIICNISWYHLIFVDEKWICDVWVAMSQLPSTHPDISADTWGYQRTDRSFTACSFRARPLQSHTSLHGYFGHCRALL